MVKLRDSRGETLIEVMVSILIASLSVALLFGCVMASSSLGDRTRDMDEAYYDSLSAAETYSGTMMPGTVTIKNNNPAIFPSSVPVGVYGGANMYSYKSTRAGT